MRVLNLRSVLAPLALGLLAAFAVASWAWVRPSLTTTVGSSMQPTFADGDLAVLRPLPRYESGDVVAYRSQSQRVILHRVIGTEADRLVVQGDNNEVVDSEQPYASQVIGSVWFRVPGGGRLLAAARLLSFVYLMARANRALAGRSA